MNTRNADLLHRKQTLFNILMDNGDSFSGSAQDIARWYCNHEHIRLFIEQEDDGSHSLYALFPPEDGQVQNNTLTFLAVFETPQHDIETACNLFFSEYLLDIDEPDFAISPCRHE